MVCVITRIGDNRKAYHTVRDIRDGSQGFRKGEVPSMFQRAEGCEWEENGEIKGTGSCVRMDQGGQGSYQGTRR